MKVTWPILLPLILLTAFGGWINANLTSKHVTKGSGPSLFAAVCTPEDNPVYNCDAVLQTKWAVFSIRHFKFVEPDPDTGTQEGAPVALLGWFYFTFVGIWYIGVGRPSYTRRIWHLVPLVTVVAGFAVSVFFMFILLFGGLENKCLWCMISHGINLLLLIGTILLWPRRPGPIPARATPVPLPGGGQPAGAPVPPPTIPGPAGSVLHPSGRLIFITLLCAAIAGYNESTLMLKARYRHLVGMYDSELKRIHEDAVTQLAQFLALAQSKVEVRPDDPRHGPQESKLTLVMFSDFQCPGCRRLAKEIQERIRPLFTDAETNAEQMAIVWKHFPGCTDCNPHVGRTIHPQACLAAYAAEAARLQGGTAAFWKAHDWMFINQRKLLRMDWPAFATELGLDAERFVQDMKSAEVHQRVAEDVEQARRLKIGSTPTVYLDGKLLRSYSVYNQEFLKQIKARYFPPPRTGGARPAPRPQTSQPAPAPATQDNPDPAGVG